MPTKKRRINMCLSNEVFNLIEARALRDSKSLASTAYELVKIALDMEEGNHYNESCDERDANPSKSYWTEEEFLEMANIKYRKI